MEMTKSFGTRGSSGQCCHSTHEPAPITLMIVTITQHVMTINLASGGLLTTLQQLAALVAGEGVVGTKDNACLRP